MADGLADEAFDWTNVGEHLDAATFNRKMEEGALVVDMRNHYECPPGIFEVGALLPEIRNLPGGGGEMMEQLEDRKPSLYSCIAPAASAAKASAWFRHQGLHAAWASCTAASSTTPGR